MAKDMESMHTVRASYIRVSLHRAEISVVISHLSAEDQNLVRCSENFTESNEPGPNHSIQTHDFTKGLHFIVNRP